MSDRERDSRLAMLGSAVTVLRSIVPAFNAIGALEDDSDLEEIETARNLASAAADALREFVERATRAASN